MKYTKGLQTIAGADMDTFLDRWNDPIVVVSGTTYTLAPADKGRTVYTTSGSATTITVPFTAEGFYCTVIQGGAGQVTFSPVSGVDLQNRQTHTKTFGQWAQVQLVCPVGNTVVLSGDTAA